MRPVPRPLLLALLLAVCGLCSVQWWRESRLRELALSQRAEITRLAAARDELDARVKAADGEILRLTAALTDLRSGSVSKQALEEALAANQRMRDSVEKQNAAIREQGESIARLNATVERANETIRSLAAERDRVAGRLNEVTALYNKLASAGKAP